MLGLYVPFNTVSALQLGLSFPSPFIPTSPPLPQTKRRSIARTLIAPLL